MKGLLLLCVFLVLGPRLRGALADGNNNSVGQSKEPSSPTGLSTPSESPAPSTNTTTSTPATSPTIKITSTSSTSTSTSTTSKPVTKGPLHFLSTSECRPVTLVAAGLILASAVLLLSNLMLACRVCTLSRRLRRRSRSFDLGGSTDNCRATGREGADENTVLLSDVGPSQEELANGAAKEEGGEEGEEGGEKREEGEKKEEGGGEEKEEGGEKKEEGAAPTGENQEEAPAAAASPPQEAVTGPQPEAAAASPSGGAEEPKDAV